MPDLEQRVQAWFAVGVDVSYSFFAVLLVAFPTLALADDAFGSPLAAAVPPVAIAFALAGTALFAGQDWSLERLGHFVVAAFGAGVGWMLVVSTLVLFLDLPREPRDPLPVLVAWTLSILTAAVLVYVGDDALGE